MLRRGTPLINNPEDCWQPGHQPRLSKYEDNYSQQQGHLFSVSEGVAYVSAFQDVPFMFNSKSVKNGTSKGYFKFPTGTLSLGWDVAQLRSSFAENK